jgi:VCBS repeat-containing protein
MRADMQIHKDVLAELVWDPRVRQKEIAVVTSAGVITLTGSVSSYAEKVAAERAAERVAGVRAVANSLTVAPPKMAVEYTDIDLAHVVADALAWDIQVPHDQIAASVTNGWVTLDGAVEWQYQRDAAEHAVQQLAGVYGVNNNITLTAKGVSAADVSLSIKHALERRADRIADGVGVEVSTTNGVVTLSGSVASYGDRRAIEAAAWMAPGVTDVRDGLTVSLGA